MIDLHCHTIASDGALSPTEIVELARKEGLTSLAITDHDSLGGIEEARKAAEGSELEIIPGIELGCGHKGCKREIHLVGLYVNTESSSFSRLAVRQRQFRIDRNTRMLENLRKHGVNITDEALSDYEQKTGKTFETLRKPDLCKIIIELSHASTRDEAMMTYLDNKVGLARTYKEKITVAEAIDIVHEAGGVAILAHPHLFLEEMKSWEEFESFISELKELGLDGLEVFYNGYTAGEIDELTGLCNKLNLLRSGGSDFHEKGYRDARPGYYGAGLKIPQKLLVKIKEYRERRQHTACT